MGSSMSTRERTGKRRGWKMLSRIKWAQSAAQPLRASCMCMHVVTSDSLDEITVLAGWFVRRIAPLHGCAYIRIAGKPIIVLMEGVVG
jgi:hypothetical protein